ncbi:MAG: NAD(P) transhydrogenase subunit alpha part 1 [Syntrophaceae bacterium PtaU1.Bin231]|nr:MAG: NAD(P) transhydrogenase subunit alpha part 1 [Syntrophaceae bacterium PtaU1.Bin231]HOG16600.1 NAD(P) transhydrogenase subunit alpha [Syntrophales bacterium]
MIIGVPKEIMVNENRVAAIPETVAKFKERGFDVVVETGAGAGAYHDDDQYRLAGARVAPDARRVYEEADIILKVKEPMFDDRTDRHELDLLVEKKMLITFLHPAAPANRRMVEILRDRNVTAFSMDAVPRISRAQRMDALTSMSSITGYKAVIIAASRLAKFIPMMATAVGMIKPANILVLGAGVVGLQACATAKRLGGAVKVVDIRPNARQEAESIGAKAVGFDLPAELAVAEGGYAKALPAEWLERERSAIEGFVKDADIVILCALVPGEVAPILLTDSMVAGMKPGSVIVDVSIDQGGNCAVTAAGSEAIRHGVHLYGIKNIPGSVPVDASRLYANNLYHYLENLFKKGMGLPDMEDDIVRSSLVTYGGKIFHQGTLKALGVA